MQKSKLVSLYLKVFIILFVVGLLFPYLLNILFNKFFLIRNDPPSGNCVFVMYSSEDRRSLIDFIIRIIGKISFWI